MPTYVWKCTGCEVHVEVLHKILDRDIPPNSQDEVSCLCEKPEWTKVFHAPQVVGKAAFLDGQRKFHDFREASKISKEARLSKDPNKRLEVAREVRKIGVRIDGGK